MATEDLEVIVNRICEYTRKLAQDNQVGALVYLQMCLEEQKRIFVTAT